MAQKIEIAHNWNADQWDWPLQHNDGVVKVLNTPDRFEVGLEVHFFTPKEIEVIEADPFDFPESADKVGFLGESSGIRPDCSLQTRRKNRQPW